VPGVSDAATGLVAFFNIGISAFKAMQKEMHSGNWVSLWGELFEQH